MMPKRTPDRDAQKDAIASMHESSEGLARESKALVEASMRARADADFLRKRAAEEERKSKEQKGSQDE